MGTTLTWSLLTSEINANRPMVFLVDSDGNGATDHFVTIVAYSDSPTQQYGCLDTWAPAGDIRWCQFRSMSSSYSWGVWGGWTFLLQPAKVTNPSPSHGATNQPPTTTLSWSNGGGATSYDVYFGTNPTPGTSQFRGNQTGTSYNPGGLLDNTTYYWRIDARGAGNGMTTGNVWNFTTGTTQPPSPPTNPSPTDGAIHQPVTVNLGWAAASGAESYNIYFGTVPEPGPSEFRGNQTATTFSPGTLEYCTIYHWRIDSKNKAGTTTGSVWTFRTKGLFGDFDCDGDIDLTDFGHLQECLTGPGVETIPSECETADYDGDHDVDIVELTRFRNCISGAGIPADPQCEP